MVQFVSDLAVLGAFGTAAWQIAGQWYRFRSSREKRVEKLGPFEAINQALKAAVAKGERPAGDWGRGAVASGHAHVVTGWNQLSADARATLVEDLLQVAVLTGQLSHIKAVREGRLKWSQLSGREQGEVLAALDSLTLDSLGVTLKDNAPELAKAWLWQVTEAVPSLAEELSLSEPCHAELALLTKAFDKADKAVKEVLSSERTRHLEALTRVMGPLNAMPATTTLKELKSLLTGSLASELGPAALSRLAADLRTSLGALAGSEDGGLAASAEVREAARKLEAQVDARVAEERLKREREVANTARATEAAHIIQVASAPSLWTASAPVMVKLALVELLLGQLQAASEGEPASATLVEAARKLVPKLPLTDEEGVSERVQALLAALGGSSDQAAGAANGGVAGSGAAGAARELAALLVGQLKDKLPAEPEAASGDAGVVSALVRGVLARVVCQGTPGGALAAAAAGAVSVGREHVVEAVRAEAERKAAAQTKPALDKIESDAAALRASLAAELLTNQMTEAKQPPAGGEQGTTSGAHRMALAAAHIQHVVLPGPGTDLAAGARQALSLLDPDSPAENGPKSLSAGATAAVAHVLQLATQLTLTTDLTGGLDMGPKLVTLLERLDSYCADVLESAKTGPATPALPNGHSEQNGSGGDVEEHNEDESEADKEGVADGDKKGNAVAPEQYMRVRELIASLLGDGLVLLELPPFEARKLSGLRAAVEGCSGSATTDAVLFNRHLTTLKDLSGQLGPIMMTLESKSGSVTGPRQSSLQALRTSAVDSYKALQELLNLEQTIRANSVDSLNEVREIVFGLKLQCSSAVLESGLARLHGVKARAESVMGWVAALQGSEDAVSEVMVMEEQVDRVLSSVSVWSDWVRLREGALGITPASPAEPEEGCELDLMPVAALESLHGGDAEFLDLYHLAGQAVDEDGNPVADADGQQGETEEEAIEQARERQDLHQKQGYKLIARGQVAVILLAGAVDGGEVRATRDVGLPSTKSALQLFAERLLKVQQLAAESALGPGAGVMRPLDWYILTPKASLSALSEFLASSAYFGLQPGHVHLVASDVSRPALSAELKIVMEAPGRMAKSPPCSGDVWASLQAAGHLRALTRRGARVVEVHTLEDNLMARPADPVFLGCFHCGGLDAAAKAGDPAALMQVYEGYAELIATTAAAQALSRLVPAVGTYAFSAAWIKGVEEVLEHNPLALYRLSPAAPKAPAGAKAAAASANPSNTVAYRMDRHLSDWVTSSGIPDMNAGVVFVDVGAEFAPVIGNPPIFVPLGPTAATDALLLLQTGWVLNAGGFLEDEHEGVVEVSPLVSYGGEGLAPLVEGRTFDEAYDLDLQGYAPTPGKQVTLPHVGLTVPLALAWVGLAAAKTLATK